MLKISWLLLTVVMVTCISFLPRPCHAVPLWGVTGHEITAQLAQMYLDDGATKMVTDLLANVSGQMYLVATWADQVVSQTKWKWSAPLHYINTPDWACKYNPSTDCPSNMCVAAAITNYTNQLVGKSQPRSEQEIAIRFTIHFHGDIHQPLHVSFASDRGGNDITGTFFGDPMNLHQVWDSGIINQRIQTDFSGSQTKYVNYLIQQINGPWNSLVPQWDSCDAPKAKTVYNCPDQWATETAALACTYAYTDQNGKKIQNGFNLGNPYYQWVKGVIDQQLAKGGIRLANTLNKLWGSSSTSAVHARRLALLRIQAVQAGQHQ